MKNLSSISSLSSQRGTSLIELLVTVLIIAIGLLGLAGLQTRVQLTEMESYQRAQGLILLDDMANRIASNRYAAASYVTGADTPLGTGMTCPTSTATRQNIDAGEWCTALQGAGELTGTTKAGAMLGGRGCVESMANGDYLVTVAWQGLGPISSPPVACGKNLYNNTSNCVNDLCRRTVSTVVRLASLN